MASPDPDIGGDIPGTAENPFLASAFWYIDALAAQGRTAEGRKPFENMLACRNRLGLLSGCIVANTNELWGNFPKTCSMSGRSTAP